MFPSRVEAVIYGKEGFLGFLFVDEELNVIYQKDVDVVLEPVDDGVAILVALEVFHELGEEVLGRHVQDLQRRETIVDGIADGL